MTVWGLSQQPQPMDCFTPTLGGGGWGGGASDTWGSTDRAFSNLGTSGWGSSGESDLLGAASSGWDWMQGGGSEIGHVSGVSGGDVGAGGGGLFNPMNAELVNSIFGADSGPAPASTPSPSPSGRRPQFAEAGANSHTAGFMEALGPDLASIAGTLMPGMGPVLSLFGGDDLNDNSIERLDRRDEYIQDQSERLEPTGINDLYKGLKGTPGIGQILGLGETAGHYQRAAGKFRNFVSGIWGD